MPSQPSNNPTATNLRKVLLTGAAGRIGSAFHHYAAEKYQFRLADRDLSKLDNPNQFETIEINVADLAACRQACEGMDTVVHLAGDPSGKADFYDSLLDNNIKGAYNVFLAAKEQGCQRVIFASSVQAIGGYPLDVQAHTDSAVKPLNMYAVSKCFGEAMAHYLAATEGLSSIALRVGTFEGNRTDWSKPHARNLSTFVSKRDLCQLISCCIEVQNVQFAIVHGVSNNRFKRMDLTSTKALVGYAPQDDAFQLFETGLTYMERWHKESG